MKSQPSPGYTKLHAAAVESLVWDRHAEVVSDKCKVVFGYRILVMWSR